MWTMSLRVKTAECSWCRQTSERHPDVAVRVLSYSSVGPERALEEVEFVGAEWPAAVAALEDAPGLHGVDVLDATVERARLRLSVAPCHLPAASAAAGATPEFPFAVQGGCDRWTVITTRAKAQAFRDDLISQGLDVELVHSGEYRPHAQLTPRQQEILDAALAAGYYEYPRRITLTALAAKLGVAKSTLSEALVVVESRLIGDDKK